RSAVWPSRSAAARPRGARTRSSCCRRRRARCGAVSTSGRFAVSACRSSASSRLRECPRTWRSASTRSSPAARRPPAWPSSPDTLVGDPRRLRQILVNLVGNAVKFTERGRVAVRVVPEAEMYGGIRLRFDVADTGVGISAAQQTRLFEPFVHGHARTAQQQEGIGLGLLITRRLAEAMGGSLGVESEAGVGSTFSCTLPLVVAPDATPVAAADLAGAPVLVLDGDDIRRTALARWL